MVYPDNIEEITQFISLGYVFEATKNQQMAGNLILYEIITRRH